MKIRELISIIEEMESIYKFSADNSDIRMVDDIRAMEHYVEVNTKDEKTGVEIILHKGF
jgi:hypothetical protein